MAKFTEMKRNFCHHVISGMKHQAACEAAGFKACRVKASQLMKEPEVIEYIEEVQYMAMLEVEITAEWILGQTKEIVEEARKEKDHRAALKGLEMLGKNKKLWTDVQEHKFDLQQMGRVLMADSEGNAIALEFNVGQEPNAIEAPKK